MDLSTLSLSLPDPLDAWYHAANLPPAYTHHPASSYPYYHHHPYYYPPTQHAWPMHWRHPYQPAHGPSSMKQTQYSNAVAGPSTLLSLPQPPLRPTLHIPEHLSVPGLVLSSPSAPNSPTSTDAPPTPSPEFVHVVCNAPLVAPKPVLYRPPAVLQFQLELPDPDEDLSHPPYTRKRKRSRDEPEDEKPGRTSTKRRATESALREINPRNSRRFSTSG
ncbi:hypothetical protein HETIRDRAFT_457467 [Heterobasidion irregulare TC 32-1]|uniref:Uncharacterized protein n=1 Tax=Heterobasidion irregulare (strain TC 32-1) TaxID=747525 RepID=W4KK69_HETIT|nr:uncharacterized protein HETIRDRAFT_457467 [Heterobasidion irregulare TC 32-1]ETW85720.1 hypothetical protein HETIRDRAFT_457467 [Heterobasidion irregulare TC 32-1]